MLDVFSKAVWQRKRTMICLLPVSPCYYRSKKMPLRGKLLHTEQKSHISLSLVRTKYEIWLPRRCQSLTDKREEAHEYSRIFPFLAITSQAFSNLLIPWLWVSVLILEAECQDEVYQKSQICLAARHIRIQDNIKTIWCQPQTHECNLSHWLPCQLHPVCAQTC